MRVQRVCGLGVAVLVFTVGMSVAQPSSAIARMTFQVPGLAAQTLASCPGVGSCKATLSDGNAEHRLVRRGRTAIQPALG